MSTKTNLVLVSKNVKNPKNPLVHHHYTHESIAITGWSIPHFSPPLLAPDSQPKSWQDKYGFEDMVPQIYQTFPVEWPIFSTISWHLSPGNAILRKQLPSTSKATAVWMAKFTNRTPRRRNHIIVLDRHSTNEAPATTWKLCGNKFRSYLEMISHPKMSRNLMLLFSWTFQLVVRFSNFLVKSCNNPPKMGG